MGRLSRLYMVSMSGSCKNVSCEYTLCNAMDGLGQVRPSLWNMLSSVLNATGLTRLENRVSDCREDLFQWAENALSVHSSLECFSLIFKRGHACQCHDHRLMT